MATPQQVDQILSAIRDMDSPALSQLCSDKLSGGHAVIKLLYTSQETVTAGRIAQYMGVSTARVAVLLKKLSCKGLIEKRRDPSDARITVVRLTDKGLAQAQRMQQHIRAQAEAVIDQVGMERLMEFVETGRLIRSCLRFPVCDL